MILETCANTYHKSANNFLHKLVNILLIKPFLRLLFNTTLNQSEQLSHNNKTRWHKLGSYLLIAFNFEDKDTQNIIKPTMYIEYLDKEISLVKMRFNGKDSLKIASQEKISLKGQDEKQYSQHPLNSVVPISISLYNNRIYESLSEYYLSDVVVKKNGQMVEYIAKSRTYRIIHDLNEKISFKKFNGKVYNIEEINRAKLELTIKLSNFIEGYIGSVLYKTIISHKLVECPKHFTRFYRTIIYIRHFTWYLLCFEVFEMQPIVNCIYWTIMWKRRFVEYLITTCGVQGRSKSQNKKPINCVNFDKINSITEANK